MDPLTAFATSITTSLGATGMALFHSYVSATVINLLTGKIERVWEKREQAKAAEEAELYQQIEQARPMREEFSRIAINATRVAAKLGFDEQASAVFGLINDVGFQADMGKWLLAANADEEKAASITVAKSMLNAFRPENLSPQKTEEFIERFFEIARRFLWSDQRIVAWRAELRDRHIQNSIRMEANSIRDTIGQAKEEIVRSILGPLVPTTADDVRKLYDLRDAHIKSVRSISRICLDGKEVRIERRVVSELVKSAKSGSLLVTGDPGSGKSISLLDAFVELRDSGHDVLYVDVQKLSSESLGSLQSELALAFPIDRILDDWPGGDEIILFIDGLDAARSESAARMIRDLIQCSMERGRWRVTASIRKFDMRYASDLKRLFAGDPVSSQFQDPEFSSLRHLSVPPLSNEELNSFAEKSPALDSLLRSASNELIQQLRTPFNIWLTADVLNTGADLTQFAAIRTQLQLLELYWQHRVIRNDSLGDAREAVAFRAASQMVSQRELKTSRQSVAHDPSASEALKDLLSSNVLSEWIPPGAVSPSRYLLNFPHNTLFDYVVNLTLFQDDPHNLIEVLKRDSTLVLFAIPSIRFFLQKLWSESPRHDRFWETAITICQDETLPKVCKVVAPAVATQFAQNLIDLDVILSALRSRDSDMQNAAVELVQHISSAAIANNVVTEKRELWISWIERLSKHLDLQVALSVNNLLWSFVNE